MQDPIPPYIGYASTYKTEGLSKELKGGFTTTACYATLFGNTQKKPILFAFPSYFVVSPTKPEWERSYKPIIEYWKTFIGLLGKPYSFEILGIDEVDEKIESTSADNFYGSPKNISNKIVAFLARADPTKVSATVCFALATLARYITEFPWIPYTMYELHTTHPNFSYDQVYLYANVKFVHKMNNHSCFDPGYCLSEEVLKTWSLKEALKNLNEPAVYGKPWSESSKKQFISALLTPRHGVRRIISADEIHTTLLSLYSPRKYSRKARSRPSPVEVLNA